MSGYLHDAVLEGVAEHGFGLRTSAERPEVRRPRQVHGARAVRDDGDAPPGEADALVTVRPGRLVGVVTADCVPVLGAAGGAVAAIHAGWRGLAAGVVSAGLEALQGAAAPGAPLRAAVGPHIGACCYEVDAPVLDALAPRFGPALEGATVPSRPGHARLDMLALVRVELLRAGVAPDALGTDAARCTRCDAASFHSYRRDGARAGRLLHWIACPALPPGDRSAA